VPLRQPSRAIDLLRSCAAAFLALFLIAGLARSDAAQAQTSSDSIIVYAGQSRVVRFPYPIKRVAVADPGVSDFRVISAQEVYLLGKTLGRTSVQLWSRDGQSFTYLVDVVIDPEPLRGQILAALPQETGVQVNAAAGSLIVGGSASDGVAGSTSYAHQPVTSGFSLNTVYPYARQIGAVDSEEWRVTPLVEAAARGWVEMSRLDERPAFDKARDFPGPVTVAAAFERSVGDRQQRVVVVGTGQMLANTFLGNGGNLQLGIAMVNWLVGEDSLVAIEPRPAADVRIELDPMMLYLIVASFLIVLPLAFAATGTVIWWRRRRAK